MVMDVSVPDCKLEMALDARSLFVYVMQPFDVKGTKLRSIAHRASRIHDTYCCTTTCFMTRHTYSTFNGVVLKYG